MVRSFDRAALFVVGFIAICHFTVRATTSWLKSALQFPAKRSNNNNHNNSMMSAIQSQYQ